MRTLNVKFFLVLVGGVVAAFAVIFGIHYFQASRIAKALLWQAEHAEQENAPDQAAKYLKRYLEFEPLDTDRRAHLGRLLASEKLAASPRARNDALFVLEPIISREPERHDLRRLVVRLAMMPRPRLKLAREHLDVLQKAFPEDGEIAQLLGMCCEADKENPRAIGDAVNFYKLAIQKSPSLRESYARLAELYRGPLQQPEQADQVMQDMVKSNANSFEAYLLRCNYYVKQGRNEAAERDAQQAAAIAPNDAEVLLAVSEAAKGRKDWDRARSSLKRGAELFPKDPRFLSAQARIEVLADKRQEAVAILRAGMKQFSGTAQSDLYWTLANLLLDDRETKLQETEELIAHLEKTGATAVPYLKARVLHRKEQWSSAAQLLERTRLRLESLGEPSRDLLTQMDLYLGDCHGQMREPTRQMEAYRRALTRDPDSLPAHVGLAAAYRSLGQIDEVIKLYDRIGKLDPLTGPDQVGYWIDVAQLRIEKNLLQREPSWKTADEAIQKVEAANPDTVEAVLLRTQLLVAQGMLDQAQERIDKAREQQPTKIEFWTGTADVLARKGAWNDAKNLLDQAERQLGDRVDLRLARARQWAARGTPEATASVKSLAQGLEKFPESDQARLLKGLGGVSSQLGDLAQAERFWKQLAQYKSHQSDPRLHMLLFDLAMVSGRDQDMRAALDAVRRIEGDHGVLSRYGQALYLIWQAEKSPDKDRLAEARQILDQLGAQRPSWPAVPLAKAEVERLQKHPELAIANYRKAVELGDRSARAIRPLVLLLYQANRYAEANQELQRLQKDILTKDLKQIAAMISLRSNQTDAAMEHAQEAIAAQSSDFNDYLWLGHMMAASRRFPEAEKNLRKAVELGPKQPETWVALVRFLADRDRAGAEKAMEELRAQLPADVMPLALAQCMETLGQSEQAIAQYQAVLSARPNDVRVIRSAVGFYIKLARTAEAEPLLRRVTSGQVQVGTDDAIWARRSLAIVLASRGHFKLFKESLSLVGMGLAEPDRIVDEKPLGTDDSEEQRTRARVLASQRISRAKAISLLEDLDRRRLQTPDDQFLLAQLYEADRAWSRAADVLRGLLADQGQQPLYVVYLAQNLLRQEKYAEAEQAIRTLEEVEKVRQAPVGALGTVELRVQLYRSQGQHDQAVALLKEHVTRKGARPEEIVVLIGYLGRVNRLREALDLCEQAWKACPPEVAGGASVNVLKAAKPSDEDYQRVERWLRAAVEQKPGSTVLHMHLADLQGQRGKFQEEETLYDQVLRLDPTNIIAMNNRAWLLALRSGNGAAARPLIEGALELTGPRPELLDTRAMVHLALNEAEPAIADLQRAVTLDSPTAKRYFHLARAYQMANKTDDARKAFRKAKELGLDRAKLHPVERTACGTVFDELDRR